MEYITVQEAAEQWDASVRLIQQLCVEGRVPGAIKFGRSWAIPADAPRPQRQRRGRKPGNRKQGLIAEEEIQKALREAGWMTAPEPEAGQTAAVEPHDQTGKKLAAGADEPRRSSGLAAETAEGGTAATLGVTALLGTPGATPLSGTAGIPETALAERTLLPMEGADGTSLPAEKPGQAPGPRWDGRLLMPLINTPFAPGQARACIQAVPEGPARDLVWAEYHYFSGQPEMAIREVEPYLTHPQTALRLSACLIFAYANLSVGLIQRAQYGLREIKVTLGAVGPEDAPELRAAAAFFATAAAVLLHLPVPEGLPLAKDYLPLLPVGLRLFGLYVQAHGAYLEKAYERSVGIVEAALAMGAEQYPIPAIYLHLVAVMDYMSLKQPQQARPHLLAAWALAQPDDLIEGFGEHHGLLGGMLEAVIKKGWPEDFKRMIAITYRFSAGWRKIHNPITGRDVADNLTTTEFAAAMLAARGWTNQEIGAHMNISPNTVKRYISQAMQKLDIHHRQDLKNYMLT